MQRHKDKIDLEIAEMEERGLIKDTSSLSQDDRENVANLVKKMLMAIASKPSDGTFRFKLEDFDFGGVLGSGRFGNVFLVKEKKTDYMLALKSVDKELIHEANMESVLKREIRIHSKLKHDNIVSFFTLFDDSANWYLLMEYVPGGTLCKLRRIQNEYRVKSILVTKYTHQLADALNYLHTLKIVHRDVKPENVLLDVNGDAKLADFGWATCCTGVLRQYCGTLYYVAPEIIEVKGYNHKVDIWSLGVLVYELLCGDVPFLSKEMKLLIKKMQKGDLNFPEDVEESAVDLVNSLLKYNPDERLEASDIMTHPWISLSCGIGKV